jgi:hypothetical protein
MQTATLTRPNPGSDLVSARRREIPWPKIALAALVLGTLVGFIVYPTFPNYDSYYSLLWGRELIHGHLPSFEAYRAPTEHPLAIAFGALLSLLGDSADRVMVGATLASFVLLAVGMYRLGRAAFTPLVGLVAAGLLCTRFDFPFLAARAYIDIPYLAFVIWAAALEAERPRRGAPVLLLLTAASLMRPEAWLLNGAYLLWVAIPATWPARLRYAALAAVGPATWLLLDAAVTGNPLFSLKHTTGLAEELGRTKGLSEVPSATWTFLQGLDKTPVLAAGILGLAAAIVLVPRRIGMPASLLVIGLATFGLVGVAGLSVIDRYLLVPSMMVMIFAAVALGGWTMLVEGSRLRRAWALGAALLVLYGIVFTATRVNLGSFDNELVFRGHAHAALERILKRPAVRAGRACGPVSVPNHKLIPDARWILNSGATGVVARSDARQARRIHHGVALYVTERLALLRQALVEKSDDPFDSIPMDGFTFVGSSGYYGAYVRCR